MFIFLSFVSSALILAASARREGGALGVLAVITIIAQVITAFVEYGFLGGTGALFIATLVEGFVVGLLARDVSDELQIG